MNRTFPILSNKPTFLLQQHKPLNRKRNHENGISNLIQDMVTTSPKAKRAKNHFNLNTSLVTELPLQVEKITKMVSENAVIVFARQGCCMCHVIERLLQGLGVNPVVHEVEDSDLKYFNKKFEDVASKFPAVFIGGKLYGGLDRVIATHISGELVPLLKQAGALWL